MNYKKFTLFVFIIFLSACANRKEDSTENKVKDTVVTPIDDKNNNSIENKGQIHDIWALTHLREKVLKISATRPNIEINLNLMQASGSGMCNNYSAKIENYDKSTIQFSPFISTKMACEGLSFEMEYFSALDETVSYMIKNTTLFFYDKDGNEILRYQKVD